ncbi:hypothetical protein BsWGS_03093 [Bradybaena similaris]
MKSDPNCIDDLVVISDEDSDSEVEFVDRTSNTEPGINRGQPGVSGEHEDKIPDSRQCSFDYVQPCAGTVCGDEVTDIRVNYQYGDRNSIASTETSYQKSYGVEETELAGDAELGIDRNEKFMDSFICHPGTEDICDVSYLMGLPKRTDKLVYVNKKTGDEGITKVSEQKDVSGQEFTGLHDAWGSRFTNVSAQIKHEQIINKEKRFQCQDCGLTCSSKHVLDRHSVIHTEEKPYKCDICGKWFKYRTYLSTHHKIIHSKEKAYKCDFCGKAFSVSSYLSRHKRRHTDEKPYKCDVCGQGFNYSSYLSTHKRIHTGEKPEMCDICGKEFNYSGYLSKHKRIHTGEKPYKCDTCGLEFACASTFRRHKNTHLGIKPYKCDTCGLEYTDHSAFIQHENGHLDNQPYM